MYLQGNGRARSGPPHRAWRSTRAVAAELRIREAAVPFTPPLDAGAPKRYSWIGFPIRDALPAPGMAA